MCRAAAAAAASVARRWQICAARSCGAARKPLSHNPSQITSLSHPNKQTNQKPTKQVEPFLDHGITRHYLSAAGVPDQAGKVIAEYVWIGGSGADLRSKSRTLNKRPERPEELPTWNYDGSSTGQAPGEDSEVYLVPRAIFRDPFRGGDNVLVMCDCYEPPRANPDGTVRVEC